LCNKMKTDVVVFAQTRSTNPQGPQTCRVKSYFLTFLSDLANHSLEHPHHLAAEDFADPAAPVLSILAPVALAMGRTRD
jgi:hypothetical protein